MGVVAWTLSASTLSSTTTCLRTLTHTCTELLGLAGLVPRVWPSPLSATSLTPRPSTRCKRGSRWTSLSCLMRSISHHTSRDDKCSGICCLLNVSLFPHFKIQPLQPQSVSPSHMTHYVFVYTI